MSTRSWSLTHAHTMAKPSHMLKSLSVAALAFAIAFAQAEELHTFKKIQLTDKFWAEGANFGDFNHDGVMDVASGPFWYEGPEFKKRHEFAPANATFKLKKDDGAQTIEGYEGGLGTINAYSDTFLVFTYDF